MSTENDDITNLQQVALRHYWQPTLPWNTLAESGPRIATAGEGVMIKVNGEWGYDAMAGLVVTNIGHGRTEVVDAVRDQLATLHYASTFHFGSPSVIRLAEKVASLTPGDLNRVQFSSGGAEAVETALKIAYQYHANRGEPGRTKFIARQDSYHGISRGALSVTTSSYGDRETFEPILPDVPRWAPQPFYYGREDRGESLDDFTRRCAQAIEDIIVAEGPETVAAVIAEPVSFSAGIAIPGDAYWPMLRAICDRHGVLLIADEVITGFGRTGKWFAMEHWGVVPDMMTLAKGITSGYFPVGACVARDHVFEAFKGGPEVTYKHGFTYGGHPAGGAAGLANIDILERESLVQNSETMGRYLLERLEGLTGHPTVVEARGIGLMTALELVSEKNARTPLSVLPDAILTLDEAMHARGVFTRSGDKLFIAPPLTVTEADVDGIINGVDASLTEMEAKLGLA